jgi:Uncharacterised nucleotidyltransferase
MPVEIQEKTSLSIVVADHHVLVQTLILIHSPSPLALTQFRVQIPDINWQTLVQLAVNHRVFPLLFSILNDHAADLIPADLMAQLRELYNQNALKTIALTGELFRILESLDAHQIAAIAFKGPILSMLAYGSLSARSAGDLDILVQPQDFLKPKVVLQSQGYTAKLLPILSQKQEQEFFWWLGEYLMVNEENHIHLDIHGRCVAGDGFAFYTDLSRFWQRLEPVSIVGRSIQTLKKEDLLLYLCISGIKDGWPQLKGVCDLSALIHRHPDLDWDMILRESSDLKLNRMLRIGLLLTHQILKTPLSDRLLHFAQADPQAVWLGDRIIKRLTTQPEGLSTPSGSERFLIRFLGLGHWKPQLQHCFFFVNRSWRLFIMVNEFDYRFFPLPRALYFLYYILRPIRLILKHRTKLINVISR